MSYREGDRVLVRAKVGRNKHTSRTNPLCVIFKNGDDFPLECVEIASVEHYDIRPGDRIHVPAKGVSPRQGVVKAVVRDIPTPQVAYMIEGEWLLCTMSLSEAKRIGPSPPQVKEGGN